LIAPPAGHTLRTTSAWEVPTHPIALAVRWITDTIGRVSVGITTIAALAGKVAGAVGAAGGDCVIREMTLLLSLLALDNVGEVVTGIILTTFVDDLPRHWVVGKEIGKER